MNATQELEEVLRTADVPTAIGAIYLAVKYITHPLAYPGERVKVEKLQSIDFLSEPELDLAISLIKVLEKHTGASIDHFSEETRSEWIAVLTQLSFGFIEKQHPYNKTRGKKLLAELRAG